MSSDAFLNENKGSNIAFKQLCCKFTQTVVNVPIAWALGSKVLPIQTVQGLWHLTTCVSQLNSLYSKKKENSNVKIMIITWIDTKGKLWSSPM